MGREWALGSEGDGVGSDSHPLVELHQVGVLAQVEVLL